MCIQCASAVPATVPAWVSEYKWKLVEVTIGHHVCKEEKEEQELDMASQRRHKHKGKAVKVVCQGGGTKLSALNCVNYSQAALTTQLLKVRMLS